MTGELEQAVHDATDAFLATILAAAEHAIVTAIRSAFATAMQQVLDERAARAELTARDAPARRGRPVGIHEPAARLGADPRAHPGAKTAVRQRAPHAATPELQAALLCRIVACVREHPGSTAPQLAPYLELSAGRLRRHLHRLAAAGVIRVERKPSELFGGQQLLTYFAGDRITPTEIGPTAAAPTAAAPTTSMAARPVPAVQRRDRPAPPARTAVHDGGVRRTDTAHRRARVGARRGQRAAERARSHDRRAASSAHGSSNGPSTPAEERNRVLRGHAYKPLNDRVRGRGRGAPDEQRRHSSKQWHPRRGVMNMTHEVEDIAEVETADSLPRNARGGEERACAIPPGASRGKQSDLGEWQREPPRLRSTAERDRLRRTLSTTHMVEGVENSSTLWQAIVARPEDDEPRRAYAAWFRTQPQQMAQHFANFMEAQLAVTTAYRADPRADVAALRRWSDSTHVSLPDFRAAMPLRRWLMDPLRLLLADGLVGWPQFYRGAVERVAMRARRFLEVGEEVFRVAPIRHLVLIEVADVARQLAESPLLARIRSLSLPAYRPSDVLTDEHLAILLASPHLSTLAHVRLVHQGKLTDRTYERLATAPTLPELSCLEVFVTAHWADRVQERYAPIGRRDRLLTRDTPRNARRMWGWIAEVERRIGHMPCFHPEIYYRPEYVDLESVIEHPIARDTEIMSNRGRRIGEPHTGALVGSDVLSSGAQAPT